MDDGKFAITGLLLLIIVLMVGVQSNEIEEESDTCVWVGVEVNLDFQHNSSVLTCEAPEKPVNGGYASESDVGGGRYNTGDTITYYCNRGHQLIGQVNRTCNATSKQWAPEEPYCEPEYIGHLMRRLNGIEDQMRAIEQRMTNMENNTLRIGYNMSFMNNRLSNIDNQMSTIDNKVAIIESKVTTTENKVTTIDNSIAAMSTPINDKLSSNGNNASAIYSMSKMAIFNGQLYDKHLEACTDITKVIDEDTVTKCMTMQMGVRNGHSVSVYTWVIEDYNSKMANEGRYYSQPFYHTVPGYKFRLRGYIYTDSDIYIYLQLLPGEYDDQLKWPVGRKHDITVLTNAGPEALHRSTSGDDAKCLLNRPTSDHDFFYDCATLSSNWGDIWKNKKHNLSNDSVVVKLYFYN